MRYFKIWSIALLCLLSACFNTPPPSFPEGDIIGYQPVYLSDPTMQIGLVAARPVENPGQIYLLGDLLLMNDVGQGIHIIDNSDPSNPQIKGFLTVSGSENMVLRDGVIYVNQFNSLLAIDISDIENVRVISRDENALKTNEYDDILPPLSGYYFECVDAEKGSVVGWRLTTITNPKCFK